jgi:hypothetical protein
MTSAGRSFAASAAKGPRACAPCSERARVVAEEEVDLVAAEVAEGDERVAALLDGALDQAAQVASVAVQVAEDEQTAHSSRAYRAPSRSRAEGSAPPKTA